MNSDNGKLITVQEAATRLNLSERTVWKYIQRRALKTSKEFSEGKRHRVMVLESSVQELQSSPSEKINEVQLNDSENDQRSPKKGDSVVLPADIYLQQQQERDSLMQGLMMYRYKFEELDKQVKQLPAPPEIVARELSDKAAALARAEEILEEAKEAQKRHAAAMDELKNKLIEEEHAKEAYRIQWEAAQAELKRPWWKKLFGAR